MPQHRGARLYRRIIAAFALPLLCSLAISVATVVYLVNNLLIRQVQTKVATDLRSAREIYDARLDQMAELVRLGANLASVRDALAAADTDALLRALQALRVRGRADILTVTDADGLIVARSRNPQRYGDDASHLAPIRAALVGEATATTEVLTLEDLSLEGADLAEQALIPILATPRASPRTSVKLEKGMALFAASPVLDGDGRLLGALYTADLLNRDYTLVDKMRSTVFADVTFEGRAVGTATLFLDDVRVSTNVPAEGGRRAIGTRVSTEVAERVLTNGEQWIDRAFVVNDWYLSAYEPLTNSRDQVVGILYVGILERPYRALVWRSLWVVGGLHAGGILVGMIILIAALYRLVERPLKTLSAGVRKIESGQLDHEIPVESDDEIGQLARDFNAMTHSLRERDAEIEDLTRSLEAKVHERSSELERRNLELLQARAEVLEMMEKQKRTNRELQRSLERQKETQEELIRSGRLAALGAMAAGVAHEINNPLATIQGNLEILEIRLEGKAQCTEACRDELETIRDQTARMRGIIENLLTFAREEKGRVEPVNLPNLVQKAIQAMAPQAEANHVAITQSFPDPFPPVLADADRLYQVFTNLAANAIQVMPTGGELRIQGKECEGGRELCVAFADTGPGIPTEDQQRVWNPFFTTRASGTGLGLSISHAIVEDLGGRIHLESRPGEGATFSVYLPRAG